VGYNRILRDDAPFERSVFGATISREAHTLHRGFGSGRIGRLHCANVRDQDNRELAAADARGQPRGRHRHDRRSGRREAAPDGYTVLFAAASTFATAPSLNPRLPYDPVKDFSPVTLVVVSPNMLTAHPSVPAQTLGELIQLAKAKPGQISFASPGVGSLSHMAGELLMRAAGIKMLHVPYKGGGLAVSDLVGGQVDLLFGSISTAVPLVRAGKLRALAVTSATRSSAVPDVPTVSESGYPGYQAVQWFGMAAPAGTPRPIVDKLRQEVVRVLPLDDVKAALAKQGFEGVGSTPEEFGAYIKAELAKWSKLFKELAMQIEQIR
jgi:tripartite-type tricarboxylate transporter receptor subunit TctC